MSRDRATPILRFIPTDCPSTVAEIGVWRGVTSETMLRKRELMMLYQVDRWSVYSHRDRVGEDTRMSRMATDRFRKALEANALRMAPYRDRVIVLEGDSVEMAHRVRDGIFDLVFIDAGHSYEAVRADIAAWLPKVRHGGVIAGDDYSYGRAPGVRRAVDEAFPDRELCDEARQIWAWRVR